MVMKIKLLYVVVVVVVVVACQKQKNQHGGAGKEHNLLSEIWVQQGVSQLSVTRIAGR